MKTLRLGCLALAMAAICNTTGWSQPTEPPANSATPEVEIEGAWRARVPGASAAGAPSSAAASYGHAFWALCLAEAGQRSEATRLTQPYLAWLADYGQYRDVHGKREPAWIRGEAEQVALVTLALIELDRVSPDPKRREQIGQFALGLALLRHVPNRSYPFRAHVSFAPGKTGSPAYAPLVNRNGDVESLAPGALWQPERSYQVRALAAASAHLADKVLLEDAQQEALGVWTHLAVSNRWPWGFSPRPTKAKSLLASATAVDNFLSLNESVRLPHYQMLAGLAAKACLSQKAANPTEEAAQRWVQGRVSKSAAEPWMAYKDLAEPVSYQVMEAENGRAVSKAFDTLDINYPNGEAGKMVRVGRDQMFWMRFDVEREAEYFFHLIFLKSQLEGGLVSVLMRIDGDKIFQVNLGGASDPFVDMDFVDGPRTLRAGPHSFGIRFAGLLMTHPAVLDSVVAWPVVERRYMGTSDGKRLLLLHNNSNEPARAAYPELPSWPPTAVHAVDGAGQAATVERQSDKRRRKDYLIVPPGGLAWLEWQER